MTGTAPPPGARPLEARERRRPGTFAALRHRNFRLFFIGQMISLVGTWMQRIAQAWLVLQITNSPFLLGLVGALQWLPVLCLALIGGAVADRVSKRNVIVVTQAVQMLQALVLGVLILTGTVRFWHVAVLATVLGTAQAFDIPARQAFIFEMVEGTDILNAVGLNSTIVNVARLLGPAIAGAAITWVGMAWAFLANGLSFIPVILALLLMRVRPARIVHVTDGILAELREGLVYLARTPLALQVTVLLAAESIFVMNFTILATVFAKDVLRMQAAQFGLLMSAQGAGALVGAITVASLSHLGPRPGFLFGGALVLTLANIALGAIHRFHAAAVVLGVAGASMVVFTATVNTTLQLGTPDRLRGRMMAVYSLVMGGMTPVGALVSGTLAQLWGASGAFGIGGLAGLAALGGVARWRLRTARRDSPSAAGAAPLWDAAGGDGGDGETGSR
ncbi:MAG: MFS transporter [Bacillati bacterium ANGP1]|uniref:MFS transporter n=1 Tax=Candidatus Segetimicrobium genomatis TaxID=2569760 RepID=A0A537JVC5_9BACT|nr:MAG: MFS transporter [Terrabacteria group bacterium ANGP1]